MIFNLEDPHSRFGEGISRPVKGARTRRFKLLVREIGASAMRVELRAESKTAALRYGRARWPHAAIEVVK